MSYLRFILAHPRFLGFGFALAFFSSFGQTFFISLSSEEIRAAFDLSHGGFGLVYSLATLASGVTIIWLGRRIDVVDLRAFTAVICTGLALACAAMWGASRVEFLVVAIFMLRLTGQGLMSHAAMTAMARYFDAGRGKAISIAGLGFSAGEAVLPAVTVWAIATLGWRQTWLAASLAVAIVVVPLSQWLLRGHAARHAAHLAALAGESAGAPGSRSPARRQWTRSEVLRDARFYLLLPAAMAPGFIVTGFFFHQRHLVDAKGWSMTYFAMCFAAFAAAQLPSAVAAGPLVDRFGGRRLVIGLLAPLALGLAILGSSAHVIAAAAFMALAGLTAGAQSPIVGSMWAELYGVRHLGGIRAMVTAILVFGTAGSPVCMGILIDEGVAMEFIAWACAAYAAGATALAAIASSSDDAVHPPPPGP